MIARALSALMPFAASIENPNVPLSESGVWDRFAWSGDPSASGVKVTHDKALTLASVWQAVSIISGDAATATLNIHKKDADDNREIDWDHPAQPLIAIDPNGEIPAFELWRRAMVHALLFGNGYIHISREGRAGKPLWLANLLPDRTGPDRDTQGNLFYWSEIGDQKVPFQPREILHIRGIGLTGDRGCDLVRSAREAIGLALAAEGHNSKFFGNGAQAGGLLEVPPGFSETAANNLEEGFREKYTGEDNWFKTLVLRDGAKFHQLTVDAERSQMHDVREDQVRDVARFFNLPPFKLGLSDSVSYNSAEQSQLVYLQGTLRHWMSAITSECRIKLLRPGQITSGSHYLEHNVSKLIEADTATLTGVLVQQRTAGFINANEARRKLNLNPRTDPGGDTYENPNTTSGNAAGDPPPEDTGEDESREEDAQDALRGLLTETLTWAAGRISKAAKVAAETSGKYITFLGEGMQVQMAAVRPKLGVAAAMAALHLSDDSSAVAASLEGQIFNGAYAALSPWVDPPHGAKELKANVTKACAEFEATVPGIVESIIGKG